MYKINHSKCTQSNTGFNQWYNKNFNTQSSLKCLTIINFQNANYFTF